MNQGVSISRKELKSISGSIREEGQRIVEYVDDDGEIIKISRSQLLSALVWNEAMPFDKETGQYKLGSARYIEMIHSCDKKDEDGSIDALTKALELVSEKINSAHENETPQIIDAEIIEDAEIVDGENDSE